MKVNHLLHAYFLVNHVNSAPSDSPHDADLAQSGYAGGHHNIEPETVSRFQHLWNITFNRDEKVRLTSRQLKLTSKMTIHATALR
jgi:hypothetical protein